MRPQRFAAIALSAALLAGAAPALAAEPAPAAAPKAGAAAKFDVRHSLCKDFLAFAPDVQGLLVAWTAGRYHKLDRWIVDEATARKVVTGVQQACQKTPEGLFRYQVAGVIDKLG